MKNHTKTYLSFFGLSTGDFIPCEICHAEAKDIHHIYARGMGGNPSQDKDNIENLMALCRGCHEFFGDKTKYKNYLQYIHLKKIESWTT